MARRTPSRAALLYLIVALTSPMPYVAVVNAVPQSAREQAKAQAERMIKEAQKGVTYDEAGRAAKTTVPTSENEKVTVSFNYGERNKIQSVLLGDGIRLDLVYDDSGLW